MMSTTVGPAGSTRFSTRRCGRPVDDVVHRPVPAVHGAVVQAQLGQRRRAAAVEHRDRVLVVEHGQQRREVAQVLLEQVEHAGDRTARRTTPAGGRPAPSAPPSRVSVAWVNTAIRLSRHSSRPRKYGRVRAERDLHAGQALRGVPVRRELVRADLQVQLQRWCTPPRGRSCRRRSPGPRTPPSMSRCRSSPRAAGSARPAGRTAGSR